MVDQDDGAAKVAELVKGIRTSMFTTTDADGTLTSRPMAVQEVEFDGDLWFFCDGTSRKVDHVRANSTVNVSFSSGSTWVSVSGDAELVQDPDKAAELWNPVVEAWFPAGLASLDLVLLRVRASGAEYWDTPGGRIASVISFVKAKATGEAYDGGDNETVSL